MRAPTAQLQLEKGILSVAVAKTDALLVGQHRRLCQPQERGKAVQVPPQHLRRHGAEHLPSSDRRRRPQPGGVLDRGYDGLQAQGQHAELQPGFWEGQRLYVRADVHIYEVREPHLIYENSAALLFHFIQCIFLTDRA